MPGKWKLRNITEARYVGKGNVSEARKIGRKVGKGYGSEVKEMQWKNGTVAKEVDKRIAVKGMTLRQEWRKWK